MGVAVDSSGKVYVADTYHDRVQKFSPSGTLLATWGSQGSGDGQFDHPQGIAVGSGTVYVADTVNYRVEQFTSSGSLLATWGTPGSGNRQFSQPGAITVDDSGHVFVADSGNNRVQKFDASGDFLTAWGSAGTGNGEFSSPGGVAVDSAGRVYVGDIGNNRIEQFGPRYDLTVTKSGAGSGTVTSTPAGIDCGATCTAPFATGTHVTLHAEAAPGSSFVGWGGDCSGTGDCQVTMGAAHQVSAVFSHPATFDLAVTKPDAGQGTVTSTPSGIDCGATCSAPFANGTQVTLHADPAPGWTFAGWGGDCSGTGDCLVTTDGDRSESATFLPTATEAPPSFLTAWSSFDDHVDLAGPSGMAVDGSGNAYVADTYNGRIVKFDSSGTVQQVFTVGNGIGDGFLWPADVAVDGSGNVYVADTGNNRVVELDPNRDFVRELDGFSFPDGRRGRLFGQGLRGRHVPRPGAEVLPERNAARDVGLPGVRRRPVRPPPRHRGRLGHGLRRRHGQLPGRAVHELGLAACDVGHPWLRQPPVQPARSHHGR